MEIIDKKEFDNAPAVPIPEDNPSNVPLLTEEEVNVIIKKLEQPVDLQKELAAKLKLYIDQRMNKELTEKGYLSDFVRRWISEYNELLDRIQKNLYVDKSVNIHLHKVSHSNISAMMRKYKNEKPSKEPSEESTVIDAEIIEEEEEKVKDDKEWIRPTDKTTQNPKKSNSRDES